MMMKLKKLNPRLNLLKRQGVQKSSELQKNPTIKVGEVNLKKLSSLDTFLLSAIIIVLGTIYIETTTYKKEEIVTASASASISKEQELSNFAALMFMLKAKESFQPKEYDCPAGFKTIGFGYNIDAHGWDPIKPYMINGKITYDGATKILVGQMEQVMTSLVTQHKLTHLNIDQQRAVASLILNCGENKIKYRFGKKKLGKSKFWKTLEKGETPDFTVYSKFKTPKGRVKFSPTLLNARKFEQALFVGDKPTIQRIGKVAKKIVIERDIRIAKEHGMKI